MKGIFARSFSRVPFLRAEKIKAANKLPTATDVLYLIMLHTDGNVDKKFQPSIFYRSRENHFSQPCLLQTDRHLKLYSSFATTQNKRENIEFCSVFKKDSDTLILNAHFIIRQC